MSAVKVLLATYQGERYLRQFLESLEGQTLTDWMAVVSDDGSSDATLEILREHEEGSPARFTVSENRGAKGAKENFSGLIGRSGSAEYYFFADQDDVWYPNKMESVLNELKRLEARFGAETPILVHSDLRLIDMHGRQIHPSMSEAQNLQAERRRELRHLLVQNNVTGCAMAINRSLRDLALPVPDEAIMHDWWLAIVAAAFGVIGYLPEPLVGYRQHADNAIGAKQYSLGLVLERLGAVDHVRQSLAATFGQASAFLSRFGDSLEARRREEVRAFATLPSAGLVERRRRIIEHGFWKAGVARNIGLFLYV